jgi:hypothetical protein
VTSIPSLELLFEVCRLADKVPGILSDPLMALANRKVPVRIQIIRRQFRILIQKLMHRYRRMGLDRPRGLDQPVGEILFFALQILCL